MKLLRPFIVWLLLVGLPLQAFAAAGMLSCALPASVQMAAAEHDMAHGTAHEHAAMPHGGHEGGDHGDCHRKPVGGKCAGAAGCCTGAALPYSASPPPLSQPARTAPIPFLGAAPATVDLAGLERPPKPPYA